MQISDQQHAIPKRIKRRGFVVKDDAHFILFYYILRMSNSFLAKGIKEGPPPPSQRASN